MPSVADQITAFPIPTRKPTGSFTGEQAVEALINAKRLQSTQPAATVATLSDAVALAASGDINVGEHVLWDEYATGTNYGGGRAVLLDAGSSGARPAANPGTIFHVGSAGLYLRKTQPSRRLHVYDFGATADDIGPALAACWALLKDVGGEIVIPGGLVKSSQQTFARAAQTVKIVAEGLCKVQPVTTPISGYLWTFSKGSGVTHVELHNVQMDGQVTAGDENSARLAFDGVLIESSNNLVLANCFGRFVDGCAWECQRAHNSILSLKTFKCGNASTFSMLCTGDPSSGDAFNDVIIAGTTEKDIKGWCFEAGTILRCAEELKIHGSTESMRGLQIVCVADYEVVCKPTLNFTQSGFVYVGDNGNSEGVSLERAITSTPLVSRGQLTVNNHYNNQCTLGSGEADLVTVDCGISGSANTVAGLFKAIATAGATVNAIGLAAGNAGASVDLSGVRFATSDPSLHVSERRTVEFTLMAGVPGVFVGTQTQLRTSFADKRTIGDYLAFSLSGNNEVPPLNFASLCHANNAFESVSDRQVITARFGATSGANALVIPAQYLLCGVDDSGNQCPSDIERIQIAATGLPGTHDDANYWRLDVYKSTAVEYSLALCMQSGATSTSLLPDRLAGNNTVGQVMDFWSGVAARYLKGNFLSCHLVKVGSPADISNLTITVQYSLRT